MYIYLWQMGVLHNLGGPFRGCHRCIGDWSLIFKGGRHAEAYCFPLNYLNA